jgi:hypothetical protein
MMYSGVLSAAGGGRSNSSSLLYLKSCSVKTWDKATRNIAEGTDNRLV